MSNKKTIVIAGVIFMIMYNIYAHSDKPVPANTGAPDENNCTQCHTGRQVNQGSGKLSISFSDNEMTYQPGQIYDMVVKIEMDTLAVFGFEMVAIQKSTNKTIGNFILNDINRTQLFSELVKEETRDYIGHTQQGTVAPQKGSNSWSFQWKSPSIPSGDIVFYAAANAANGNGNRFSDWIYTENILLKESLNAAETADRSTRDLFNATLKNNSLHLTYGVSNSEVIIISLTDAKGNLIQKLKTNREDSGIKEEVYELSPHLSGVFFIKILKNRHITEK